MQFEPALFSCCAARRLVGIPAIPRADRRVVSGSAYDCASSWASRTHCSDMPRRHDRGEAILTARGLRDRRAWIVDRAASRGGTH
jgi:hypothetical protein